MFMEKDKNYSELLWVQVKTLHKLASFQQMTEINPYEVEKL